MHASKAQQAALITITKRADFLKIQSKGRKWVSHGLVVQTMPNDLGVRRIGFTVTKRTDKSAVKRNRIKRRLRAVAADILPVHAQAGCDYILVGRPQTATRGYDVLCNDLKWCLGKLDLKVKTANEKIIK
ncbi:MAG: ribonuclease P protein component [Bdellovibrionales bacterium]